DFTPASRAGHAVAPRFDHITADATGARVESRHRRVAERGRNSRNPFQKIVQSSYHPVTTSYSHHYGYFRRLFLSGILLENFGCVAQNETSRACGSFALFHTTTNSTL